ncbi:hypothetical protein [Algicola sagamiensis]|uniref:hypothetical protein n=1 Tax=Algicola sagamiensis TaxID=163869 RepID=UPI00037E6830|nr:hypothetical protein [Algicola sagamiensis]
MKVLLDGVWHHLDHEERELSIKKFSSLLANNGICAISLRNGPAGAGKHVFPTSSSELIQYAEKYNFHIVLHVEHQPSQMPNKKDVIWSRIAMQKVG